MVTLTMNYPDEKYTRLKQLAEYHNIKVNQLLDELTTGAFSRSQTPFGNACNLAPRCIFNEKKKRLLYQI